MPNNEFESEKNEEVAEPQNSQIENLNNESDDTVDNDPEFESFDESEVETESEDPEDNKKEDHDQSEKNPDLAERERDYEKDRLLASARRESEEKLKKAEERQTSFAKKLGYNSFDELVESQTKQEYIDQGYDEEVANKMIEMDKIINEYKAQTLTMNIEKEKARLRDKRFFNEIEKDLDEMLKQSPNTPVETVYKYLVGEKIEDLMAKGQSISKQKALNTINNKNHIKGEKSGANIDSTKVDEEEWRIYKILNKKAKREDWIKFKKEYG